MRDDDRAAVLRQSLAKANHQRAGGEGFPAALKNEVTAFVRRERAAGQSYASLGAALGVSGVSLSKWDRALVEAPFAAVEIVATTEVGGGLVVHGPSGLRVEGVTIDDIARLWARLR